MVVLHSGATEPSKLVGRKRHYLIALATFELCRRLVTRSIRRRGEPHFDDLDAVLEFDTLDDFRSLPPTPMLHGSCRSFRVVRYRPIFAARSGAEGTGCGPRLSQERRQGSGEHYSFHRNRLYAGQFEWNGKLIQGKHETLVSVELWERVQGVMDGRFIKNHRRMRHDFAFSSLIACDKCGCPAAPNTSGSATASTPCISTSSMGA
jgi:hypothetical protein